MDNSIRRGSFEMTAAMLISGTIGWFVLVSGQPVLDVVFWRCLFGAGTLLLICAAFGFLRPGILTRTTFLLAVAQWCGDRRQLGAVVRLLFPRLDCHRHRGLQRTAIHAGGAWPLFSSTRKSRCRSWHGWAFRFSGCWRLSVPMAGKARAVTST